MEQLQTILLQNRQGMSVEVINFGARIKSILFPVNGVATDMTVGYDNLDDYLTDEYYLGATCGRVCNRVENAEFELNGVKYKLTKNDGKQCLHGGTDNFSTRFWQVISSSPSTVVLKIESESGDQGFPGKLILQVTYELTEQNQLKINYSATTNAATPINITNHAYFNLGNESCEQLDLKICASNMLERKSNGVPSGNILPVVNSDFDFSKLTNIGIKHKYPLDTDLQNMACYDHCYVFDVTEANNSQGTHNNEHKNQDYLGLPKAVLYSKSNHIKMTLFTNQPAVQLYTGVALSGNFRPYQGVCLEAQDYSNAVNISHFPSTILQPNDEYTREIIYQFEYDNSSLSNQ
ncbi:aldose epimerase family protein [Colwellia sp. 1_MG-2023]|uniref:aldose epimerase family protein n=1 Tax=unclassified Colwellia TaxID=196834 RepID=UPI001C09A584|nr:MULTISPECIES: aldose epimerase family protein [unclassified Colwellia]MBU2924275.1 galactose mutarotase [Colwellia sp. C2M11]MDO6652984.1 aldose epimerase family protein [Colwellia sp. 3_MG-2023]MDO6665466.1 aldose epimerase family protein [Colwellia sp. 2_MG-2023]MDO6689775.1 aldose epimerase family protein [Colwellia sp. 1_MG-2023]